MKLPTPASPGAASRRSLLADLLVALLIAGIVIALAAGIGVVGFVALIAALLLLLWYGIEGLVRLARRRRERKRRRADRVAKGSPQPFRARKDDAKEPPLPLPNDEKRPL